MDALAGVGDRGGGGPGDLLPFRTLETPDGGIPAEWGESVDGKKHYSIGPESIGPPLQRGCGDALPNAERKKCSAHHRCEVPVEIFNLDAKEEAQI